MNKTRVIKTKYKMLNRVLNVLILFSSISLISCDNSVEEKQKPNVVFILADDLGYFDLSCMGSDYYETPNIDRIANEGMVFTNGYAACQVCSPSRVSIMSGKFPARHGITDWIGAKTGEDWRKAGRFNKLLPPENGDHLPHEYTVLPEALKDAGYTTFFAGKWHMGGEGSLPQDHGFDVNQGGFHAGGPYTGGYFSPFNNPQMEDRPEEKGMSLSMKLASETVRFIRDNKDTSFFAYLSFYAVHAPIQTTKEKWKKYRDKAAEAGIADRGYEMGHFLPIRQVQDNPVYAGLVEMMDDAVGHVLNALDELGLEENTIVVFTSDNGGVSAGDAFATSNLPLRGGKGYQFEGGMREPYFIKVPWMDIAGRKTSTPATGTDFYPTILELTGEELNTREHNDGVSLVPVLKGDTIADRPLIWHYPHYGNQGGEPSSIVRLGEWKLIHYYEDGREELYNLVNDPEESNDLGGKNPQLKEKLGVVLFDYLEEAGAKFPKPDPEYDAKKEEEYLKKVVSVRMPKLEKQRLDFLSNDYDPGNNWWGSEVSEN